MYIINHMTITNEYNNIVCVCKSRSYSSYNVIKTLPLVGHVAQYKRVRLSYGNIFAKFARKALY